MQSLDRVSIPEIKFDRVGRMLLIINIVLIVIYVFVSLYIYFILPDVVPTHFNVYGKPDSYGSKIVFLYTTLTTLPVEFIVLILVRYRFKIINKYPYLVNYPVMVMLLSSDKIEPVKKAYYINEINKVLIITNIILCIMFIAISTIVGYAMLIKYFPATIFYIVLIAFTVMIIGIPLIMYRNIHRKIKAELGK